MAAPDPVAASRIRAEVAAFLDSDHAVPFRSFRDGVGDVARTFLEVCYATLGLEPAALDEEHLRDALLKELPPRLDPGAPVSARAPAIVRALLDHQFETRPNPNAWNFPALFDVADSGFVARLRKSGGSAVAPAATIERAGSKLGRNDPCPCGSGKKFKKCCG